MKGCSTYATDICKSRWPYVNKSWIAFTIIFSVFYHPIWRMRILNPFSITWIYGSIPKRLPYHQPWRTENFLRWTCGILPGMSESVWNGQVKNEHFSSSNLSQTSLETLTSLPFAETSDNKEIVSLRLMFQINTIMSSTNLRYNLAYYDLFQT